MNANYLLGQAAADMPTWKEVVTVLLFLGLLASIVGNISQVVIARRKEGVPQPLDVKVVSGMAKASDLAELRQHVDKEFTQLAVGRRTLHTKVDAISKETRDLVEGSAKETREMVGNVTKQINDVDKKVAALDAKTEQQNSWLERIDEKLDVINRKT